MDSGSSTAEPTAGTSQNQSADRQGIITFGQTVLFRLPRGDTRSLVLKPNSTVSLGKAGSFHASELIGDPYGLAYEIVNQKLHKLPPKTIQELEITEATNELINEDKTVQPLTTAEIEALKQSGAHSSDIIQKQIEQHANFALKTEYSKEKYKKRKEAKYSFSKTFSTIEPTLFNVCEYWYTKDQNRLRDIRADALTQMLNLASVRPGGRYIVVDGASGALVAGVLDRLGGLGRVVDICDIESAPTYPVVQSMNFDRDMIKQTLVSLNWAMVQEDYTPVLPPTEVPSGELYSDKQIHRISKRRAVVDQLDASRQDFFSGEFDGLLVSSEYDPWSILEMTYPYISGSASIVFHCPHLQARLPMEFSFILVDLQAKMKAAGGYLGMNITEAWKRKYQVLPGRTHPLMNMSGTGGYILHALKIFDDPNAQAILIHRQKKRKTEKPDEAQAVGEDVAMSDSTEGK
ncbi:Gcd10p-domain-containing protein [Thelephora terrestris]|uniref:tRNA (adenine(58)-N(1))-methyltransferase non-catalytic subunit TRM6 n=1 Tax=Thelephora terrestris TaxID=56493 RepID=A0A9P6HHW1_9AGAM|nr:Gcd10p-domain-containing protein [Thelephora terrestris]